MEWPSQVEKVYVICHPVKEKERYDRLLPHMLERGIPRERIEFVAPHWGTDLTASLIFQVWDPFLPRDCPTLTFKGRSLTKPEISLNLNFYYAMTAAVDSGASVVMTLESDIFLRDDFVPRLWDLLKDLETRYTSASGNCDWDYVSLGEGVGTRPPGAPESMYAPTKAYTPPHQLVFRCTDSMLFHTKFLKKVVKTYLPFREIIDWEMNYQNMIHGGKALWADPPLAEQGTCYGRILTSLPA
jgi:hypothetical protein